MVNITDISKLTDKLDLQKIVKSVKSMVAPGVVVPESAKDDPMGYKMLEISKEVKNLVDLHAKMAEGLAKVNNMVGSLYQDVAALKAAATAVPAPAPAAKS
jgi:hypothetical protein